MEWFRDTVSPQELVQWETDRWHRGRVLRTDQGEVVMHHGVGYSPGSSDAVLVKHSHTNELEFVDWGCLTVMPEEHPE